MFIFVDKRDSKKNQHVHPNRRHLRSHWPFLISLTRASMTQRLSHSVIVLREILSRLCSTVVRHSVWDRKMLPMLLYFSFNVYLSTFPDCETVLDRHFCTSWIQQEWCLWGDNMSLTYNGEKEHLIHSVLGNVEPAKTFRHFGNGNKLCLNLDHMCY